MVRGVDGQLKRLTNSSGVLPATSPWTVTALPPLPNGLTVAGSPASGGSTTVKASDGALWSLSGSVWTMIAGPELAVDGAVSATTRSDGSGTDMWVHGEDHARRKITYTSATGWQPGEAEQQGGVWAGSPASIRLSNGPSVVLGIDQSGALSSEISRGIEGTFITGPGFVGSPAAVPFGPNGAVAAVRSDGHLTVMTLGYTGTLDKPQGWYTVGQPGRPDPTSPASGALIAPGTDVTMTVTPSSGATDYRWTLFEVPLSGVENQIITETLAGSAGTTWTVPADTFRNGLRYRWQAEAFRSDTGLYKKSNLQRYFTVTDGLAPAQLSPADGADVTVDSTGSTVLTTGSVPGAIRYRFTLVRSGRQKQSQDVECCPGGETTVAWTVPDGWIVPGGTYSWSVQAVFYGQIGSPSPARSFTAITPGGAPATPTLISPGEGARVANVSGWNPLTAGSPTNGHLREYRFELWERSAAGRTWVAGHTSPPDHENPTATWELPTGTLTANRVYEWTVRVYDHATRQLSGWPQPRGLSTITDTLDTNQVLTAGSELRSPSGYRLVMQGDGNLVVYRPDGGVQAATNRFAYDAGAYLVMQGDGNLVEYYNQGPSSRKVVWASGSRGSGAYLVMQDDGNAVVYRRNSNGTRTAIWASNSLIPPPPPNPWPTTPGTGLTYPNGRVPVGTIVTEAANSNNPERSKGGPTESAKAYGGITLPARKTGICDGGWFGAIGRPNSACGAGKLYDMLYFGLRRGNGSGVPTLAGLLFSLSEVKSNGYKFQSGLVWSPSARRIVAVIESTTPGLYSSQDSVTLSQWRYFTLKYLNWYYTRTVDNIRGISTLMDIGRFVDGFGLATSLATAPKLSVALAEAAVKEMWTGASVNDLVSTAEQQKFGKLKNAIDSMVSARLTAIAALLEEGGSPTVCQTDQLYTLASGC